MAIFRKVHVSFWKDEYVEGLGKEGKFLFLYLLTNDRATQCGIYEITLKQMSFDTGFTIPELLLLLEQFEKDRKIIYNAETKEIALKNWSKYNDSSSPKVVACIKKELKNVKDKQLILYLYSMHTVSNQFGMCIDTQSQEEEDKDKEEDVEAEQPINNDKFFEFFRRVAGRHIADNDLNLEIAKFKNRYPNIHINQAGALINTWVANIGRVPQRQKSKNDFI